MSLANRSAGLIAPVVALVTAGCAGEEPTTATTIAALAASCHNGVVNDGELCPGPAISLLAQGGVRAVVAVDLNNDGLIDVAGVGPSKAFVRLRGPGGWGAWWTWSIPGTDYRDIAAGDFDNDGDRDLVIADFAHDRVLVHRNAGGGALAAPLAFPVGDGPIRVLAARLDAGNFADIVTVDANALGATVRLGSAAVFGVPMAYAIGKTPDLALGDCNGDGWLDLIYSSGTGAGHVVRARRGNNVAAFMLPLSTVVPLPPVPPALMDPVADPRAIVAGDLDVDGFADAVVTSDGSYVVPATSNGNCTFTPAAPSQTWAYALRPDLVDLDSDGALDLLAPHLDDAVSAVFGAGDGSFPGGAAVLFPELFPAAQFPVIPNVYDIAPADVTGDGRRDFVLATDQGLLLWRGAN